MAEFVANAEVNLTGNLARQARVSGAAFGRFATRAARDAQKVRNATVGLSNGIDRFSSRYTGLIAGGAVAFKAKGVIEFDAKLKDIERQARLSAEKVAELKKEIYDTAQQPDIRVDPGEIVSAIDAIIEKTGDYNLAVDNIRNIGLAIRGGSARGQDVGAVIAGFEKLGVTKPQEVAQALEYLVVQGKEGSFTLQNFARESGPMLASLAAFDQTGLPAIKTMGALAQVTQSATDSSAETGTAFSALLRDIAAKSTELEANGVRVFDEEAAARGIEKFNDLGVIVRDIIEKSGGSLKSLGQVFGDESLKALKTLAAEYKKTEGSLPTLDKFLAVEGNTGEFARDAAEKATTMAAALTSLNTALQRKSLDSLSEPLQEIADAINDIEPEKLNRLFDIAATTAAAVAGVWAVNKALRGTVGAVNAVRGLRRAGRTGRRAATAANAAATTPVFVTNWPPGLNTGFDRRQRATRPGPRRTGTGAAVLGATAATTQGARQGVRAASGFVRGAAPVAVGFAALEGGLALSEGDTRGAVAAGGTLAGALAGGKAGAFAGSLFGPIGTAIGAAVGAAGGALVGREAIQSIFDAVTGEEKSIFDEPKEPAPAKPKVKPPSDDPLFKSVPAGLAGHLQQRRLNDLQREFDARIDPAGTRNPDFQAAVTRQAFNDAGLDQPQGSLRDYIEALQDNTRALKDGKRRHIGASTEAGGLSTGAP